MNTRRDFLALSGAVACTALPAAASAEPACHPDAELLAACAAFDVLERAYIAVPADLRIHTPEADAADAERERISEAQDPFIARICELKALTREGMAARARSLALWDGDLFRAGGDVRRQFAAAIVRDLIASE